MSRIAAAPFTRLRGLLRSGPAGIEPATADDAPMTDAPMTDAPVATDEPPPVLDAPTVLENSAEVFGENRPVDEAVIETASAGAAPVAQDHPAVAVIEESSVPVAQMAIADSGEASEEIVASATAACDATAASRGIVAIETPVDEPAGAEAVVIEAAPVPDEPVLILDAPIAAEDPSATTAELVDDPVVAIEATPERKPPVEVPAPSVRLEQAPAKSATGEDRSTLIRRRWAETGIRMWNPRLHGTGDAALSIQGQVALLPPATGEKLPRYDRLEFKLLGGQIVCEGVILDAPAHAGSRNFTRLAEPHPQRAREMPAERQAVPA